MKILLDPQIFNQQTYGGISRYYTEIFTRISKKKDVDVLLPILITNNYYLKENKQLLKKGIFSSIHKILSFFKVSTKSLTRKNTEKQVEQVFQEGRYDVFVPTYYNPYFLEKIQDKPFVLTVYDMIHELYPKYFVNDPFNVVENKKLVIQNAAKIIAVSQNTKKDILKFYPNLNPEKIVVIHHGNSIQIDEKVKVDLPQNYILFVGSRENYKNFQLLVEAVEELLKSDQSLYLVAAGGGKFSEEEVSFIKSIGLEKQIVQKYFEEKELGQFYKNAKCFVFPSAYEGFGIPVLEAMACGCPIILSNASSFPEVAGEAGIYFETNSKEDLQIKISDVLADHNLRASYIKKGFEQIKKFDWDAAAEKCLQVYKEAILQK